MVKLGLSIFVLGTVLSLSAYAGDAETIRGLQEKAAALKSLRCTEILVIRGSVHEAGKPIRMLPGFETKRQALWRFPDRARIIEESKYGKKEYLLTDGKAYDISGDGKSARCLDLKKLEEALGPMGDSFGLSKAQISLFGFFNIDPGASKIVETKEEGGGKRYVIEGVTYPHIVPASGAAVRNNVKLTVGEDGVPRASFEKRSNADEAEATVDQVEINPELPDALFALPEDIAVNDETDQTVAAIKPAMERMKGKGPGVSKESRPALLLKLMGKETKQP